MITVRKLLVVLMTLAMLSGVLVVQAQDGPEGTVKLAVIGPFTGGAASIGQEQLQWARLAVDDFNEANDWNVEVVEVDTQLDAALAVTAVESILGDAEVYGAVGPAGSQEVAAVAEQFVEAGLVHISSSATNPDLTLENDWPTFFRVVPTDAVQGPTDAQYIYHDLGLTRLFILDDQTSYSVGLADQAEATFEELGGEIVGRESITQEDTDFSAIVTRIGSSDAEVIFFPGQIASQGALLATQMLEQGVDVVFFGADGFISQEDFIDAAAGTTEGAYVSSFAPDIRGVESSQDEIERYVAEYDDQFGTFGPPTYLAAQVVLEAMWRDYEADGELSREGTLAEVSNTNMELSILGTPIAFDDQGDVENASFFVFQVEDGAFVLRGTSSMGMEMEATEEAGD